jgi:TolB-like protein
MSADDTPVSRLLREMRRRRVFRTAALYIVGTWLVMQVADVVFPAMDIPERAIRYVLIAAILGFPAAIVFGWFYDIGVHGIRRTAPAGAEELAAAQPLRRTDYVILTALAGVAAAIIYTAVGSVVEAPGRTHETRGEGPPMVAVLPFVSKSLEGESEFFAIGVHDDLLTQLAQLQSIRVISRTSVLEYKDTVKNIREIGRELLADAILEGGVQHAGDRIRINAQLIDARTDEHLWAQTYDRELSATNIFEVQTEIARAITSAMRATLTEQDATQLAVIPTENMAAYRAYRRAMDMREGVSIWMNSSYREALEEAGALDPTFTRAWAELVGWLSHANFYGEINPEWTQRAEEILEKIQILAPNSVDHLMAQSYYAYYTLKDYERANRFITQAMSMAPSDINLPQLKSWIQRRQGKYEDRIETLRLGQELDPRNPQWTSSIIYTLMLTHQYDEAARVLESTEFKGSGLSYFRSLLQLRQHRDFERWGSDIEALQKEFEGDADPSDLWEEYIAARNFAAAEKQLSFLRGAPGRDDDPIPYLSDWMVGEIITYWALGQDDRLAEAVNRARTHLDKSRTADGSFKYSAMYFEIALVTAAEGDAEKTEQHYRRLLRVFADKAADFAMSRTFACQALGMAGAAAAAVECIRTGIAEPSSVHPFFEPYLPYYDPVRDDPLFVELLADLERKYTGK